MAEHQNRARVTAMLKARYQAIANAHENDPRRLLLARDLTSHAWEKVDKSLSDVLDLVDDPVMAAFIAMDVGALVLGTSMIHMMAGAINELKIPLSREAMHAIRNNVMFNVNRRLTDGINEGSFDLPQPSKRGETGD